VTVEGQVLGRIEGFRFRQDEGGEPDEAKTLRQAAMAALQARVPPARRPFYNAPDTAFEMTEQGGLMWGEQAVGRLVAGARGDEARGPRPSSTKTRAPR
jgi:ATP-dependent RNA helicase SUPV3L1/SUV3